MNKPVEFGSIVRHDKIERGRVADFGFVEG
jgi:hypothetical protein